MIISLIAISIIFIMIFTIYRMLKGRDEYISLKSSVVVFLGILVITFSNSILSGGTGQMMKMLQINLIASTIMALVVWFLFFWKKADLYYYLDENHIIMKKNPYLNSKEMDELKIDEKVEYTDQQFLDSRNEQKNRQEQIKVDAMARLNRDIEYAKDIKFNPASFSFEAKESNGDVVDSIMDVTKRHQVKIEDKEVENDNK